MTKAIQSEPTLKDIADATGVSVAAVSKVLNNREGVGEDTRRRVMEMMETMGYRGRAGRGTPELRVTLLTLEQYVTNDAFYGDILAGIHAAAQRHSIVTGLRVFRGIPEMAGANALRAVGEAALLVGVDHPSVIEQLTAQDCASVIVNGMDRSMRLSSVSPDYHFGAWQATKHLLDLGHRDIVHVTHPYRETIRRRVEGFRDALEEAGIAYAPEVHLLDLETPAHINLAARDIVFAKLSARNQLPTAIFCINDMVALGTIQALQHMGLSVPGDVSVIGFDGLAIGGYSAPQLSSIQTDRTALGRLGMDLMVARMADPALPIQRITLGGKLLVRQSSRPIGTLQARPGPDSYA